MTLFHTLFFQTFNFDAWANDIIWEFWDGKIPIRAAKPRVQELEITYESQKVQLYFPKKGLAGVVKKNFPMSGEATNGEILFYYDC